VETIKQQTGGKWLFDRRSKSVGAGSAYGLQAMHQLCDKKCCCSCRMWLVALYKCYMLLPT